MRPYASFFMWYYISIKILCFFSANCTSILLQFSQSNTVLTLSRFFWGGGDSVPSPLVSQEIMHIQGCVSHVYTFEPDPMEKDFCPWDLYKDVKGDLHDSRFRARHDAITTLKPPNSPNELWATTNVRCSYIHIYNGRLSSLFTWPHFQLIFL